MKPVKVIRVTIKIAILIIICKIGFKIFLDGMKKKKKDRHSQDSMFRDSKERPSFLWRHKGSVAKRSL